MTNRWGRFVWLSIGIITLLLAVRISLLFINYILCAEKTLVVHRASKKWRMIGQVARETYVSRSSSNWCQSMNDFCVVINWSSIDRYQSIPIDFIDWFGLIAWFSDRVPSIGYPGYWKPSLLSFWEFCLVQLSLLAFVLSVILVPMDLDVTTKAVVLGSCFLIVSSHSHNTILSKVYCKQEPWSKQDIGSETKEPERKFALSPWKLCPRLKPPRARGTFGSGDENVAGNTVLETDTKGCKIYWMLSIPQPSSTRGVQKILNSFWLF